MELGMFEYYLIGVNVLGFILFGINYLLYTYTPEGQVDGLLNIVSLAGGSLGIVIAIFLIDRKPHKKVMMSRVFVWCVLVIQILIFLMLKGYIKSDITLAFWDFFAQHKAFAVYLLCINLVTFIAFFVDKYQAIHRRSRIRIVTLLGLAFFGGSIGALAGMYGFRHKIRKDYFTVGVPLIILMQLVLLFYLMNGKLF